MSERNKQIKWAKEVFYSLIGSIEPVSTTGFPTFSNMKLNTDAVYAIVSVPCRITNLRIRHFFKSTRNTTSLETPQACKTQ